MALIAGSITTTIREASAIGSGTYPSPFVLHGYLTAASSAYTGAGLAFVSGRLTPYNTSALVIGATTAYAGICGPMGPRRQEIEPLTSASTPAEALPGQYTTPTDPASVSGALGELGWFEENIGFEYYAAMAGNFFFGHGFTRHATNGGTDLAASFTGIMGATCQVSCRFDNPTADSYYSETGITIPQKGGVRDSAFVLASGTNPTSRIVGLRNPQPLSWTSNTVLVNSPGPVVISGATATMNPVVIATTTASAWM